eukprot:s2541_g13.t1
MTSIVDPEAQFDLRLEQVNVPPPLRVAIKNAGINSIASLAYSHGQPGQPIVEEAFANWVRRLDPTVTVGGLASLKRLLLESQTQLLATLKDQITNPEAFSSKRVPQAEREARLANLRRRLNGVSTEGHSEPSHHLLDLASQMYDQNILKCVPLEKCYSRLTELTNSSTKQQTKLLEVEAAKIVLKDKESELETNVQSSYQALEAMKRRGLAFDFAGIMSYTKHDRYVQSLFSHLNREPPSGYSRCSISQLIAADKAAWTHLIEQNIKPRPDAAAVLALDTKLEEALKTYEVSFVLLPLATKVQQKPQPAPKATAVPHQPKGGKKGNNRKEKEKERTSFFSVFPKRSVKLEEQPALLMAAQDVLTTCSDAAKSRYQRAPDARKGIICVALTTGRTVCSITRKA